MKETAFKVVSRATGAQQEAAQSREYLHENKNDEKVIGK